MALETGVVTTEQVIAFLDAQRTSLSNDQWMESYQSWARGGNGWNRYGIGGTYIHTALAWYQHIHIPGSKEWRPSIVMRAVELHAGVQYA